MFTKNFKFSTYSPLFIPVHFTCRMVMNFFEWKIEEWKERKELFFCKLNIKDGNVFYRDIYTITTIKMFTCSYIKKSLKKCLRAFNKSFSNYQATYQKELYLLFEKSGNFFHRVSIEIGLTPPLLSPVCFHSFSTDLSLPSRTSPLF